MSSNDHEKKQEIDQEKDSKNKENKKDEPFITIPALMKFLGKKQSRKTTPSLKQSVLTNAEGEPFELQPGRKKPGSTFLGEGGFGKVKQAKPKERDNMAAKILKLNKDDSYGDKHNIESSLNEVNALKRLGYDAYLIYIPGEKQDKIYIIQPIVQGKQIETVFEDLAKELREALDKKNEATQYKLYLEFMTILLSLLTEVKIAHEKGVVHNDINPTNVLVERDKGKARLIDFGESTFPNQDLMTKEIFNEFQRIARLMVEHELMWSNTLTQLTPFLAQEMEELRAFIRSISFYREGFFKESEHQTNVRKYLTEYLMNKKTKLELAAHTTHVPILQTGAVKEPELQFSRGAHRLPTSSTSSVEQGKEKENPQGPDPIKP